MDACRKLLKENLDYDLLAMRHPEDMEQIDGYIELMAEVYTSRRKSIRINQEDYPLALVKSQFEKFTSEHILYVLDCVTRNTTRIGNIRAYLLSALFNAPNTMAQYYSSLVSHDMAEQEK